MNIQACLRFLCAIVLCFAAIDDSYAQRATYMVSNPEGRRPNPPVELRIGTVSTDGTVQYDPPSYKHILKALRSEDARTRSSAALELYRERNRHYYYVDDLVALLSSDEEVVTYVSSVLLDAMVSKPYRSAALLSHSTQFTQLYWRTSNSHIRANSLALAALSLSEFTSIQPLITDALVTGDESSARNAAVAVDSFAPPSIDIFGLLVARMKRSKQVAPYIADAMVRIASVLSVGSEGFTADRLTEGSKMLAELGGFNEHAAYIERSAKRIRENSASESALMVPAVAEKQFLIEPSVDLEIFKTKNLEVNGNQLDRFSVDAARSSLLVLGERNPFQQGLNFLKSSATTASLWLEDRKLKKFEYPYRRSYAIIVAIDEYNSLSGRYRPLNNMVSNAKLLAGELEKTGFPSEHILFLFNERATSRNIQALLEEFWDGGKYRDADRLVFYFGGHGDNISRNSDEESAERVGFLITADFDETQPTRTSLLLRDLTGRHFENIVSRHVLMLVDSCSSGLALPRFQNANSERAELERFRRYAAIKSESERPARNILVAGTGKQEALWENGGVFTRSLIEGIAGAADFNRDRIIEFDELALYSKDTVRAKAIATGVEQEPAAFKATAWGKGSVLLLHQ
jgi:hypothetical protein